MNINWELLSIILSLVLLFGFGFLLGMLFSSKIGLYLKITKKEDYEDKVKALDLMMDEWNNRINEVETSDEPKQKIRPFELFPEDLNRDFGLPRELK